VYVTETFTDRNYANRVLESIYLEVQISNYSSLDNILLPERPYVLQSVGMNVLD